MSVDPFSALTFALKTAQTISSANARSRQLSAQAAFQQQQAERARAINDARAHQLRRNQSRERAAGRARLTSSGIDPSAGSALLLQENQAGIHEFDRLLARSVGLQASLEADQQARVLRMQASSTRQQGLLSAAGTAADRGPGVFRDIQKFFDS